jgi:hypothetical protein
MPLKLLKKLITEDLTPDLAVISGCVAPRKDELEAS